MPRALGINRHSYPGEHFYSDVQSYIRFKTPVIALRTLADDDDPLSPLGSIDTLVESLRQAPRDERLRRRLGQELRMLGCVARARIRDRVRTIRERIEMVPERPAAGDPKVADARALVDRLLADVEVLLAAWRRRRTDFVDGELPPETRETYACTDEYLSMILEQRLTQLLGDIDRRPGPREALAEVRGRLRAALLTERAYRSGAGHAGADDGDEEYFVYRRGMLKKFVNSVLWLEISKQKEGRGLSNLGAAIAAGTAMAFALVAAIVGSRWYVMNTWGFVVAGTLTYILKDRIKDWLKGFFSSRTGRWLADYAVDIRDPITGNQIGRCRESFHYLGESKVPRDVLAFRHADARSPIEPQAKPEVVIKYEKSVRLGNAALIERLHLEDYELNDIMRFSLAQFLVRADDPTSTVPVYDPERDAVTTRAFHKVYHLNVVMVFTAVDAPPVMKRVRVVFDKHGIRRLEEVA